MALQAQVFFADQEVENEVNIKLKTAQFNVQLYYCTSKLRPWSNLGWKFTNIEVVFLKVVLGFCLEIQLFKPQIATLLL